MYVTVVVVVIVVVLLGFTLPLATCMLSMVSNVAPVILPQLVVILLLVVVLVVVVVVSLYYQYCCHQLWLLCPPDLSIVLWQSVFLFLKLEDIIFKT